MPGEHHCTPCNRDLRKHKDTYVKIKWYNYVGKTTKIAVVCPTCRVGDEKLDSALTKLYEVIFKETVKRGNTCTLCGESIKKREKSLEAQFREDDDEVIGKVCAKCLEIHPEYNDIKVRFPNPTFKATVTCQVTGECDTYKKPSRDRGINCQHIVCNMDGDLYCRRAHPGHLKMYREKWAFPPSMKRMRKVMAKFLPIMERVAELADEETIKSLFPNITNIPNDLDLNLVQIEKETK